jgi:hypothetical protein
VKNNSSLLHEPNTFDLFRLSNSKKTVDVCANTLREYNERGLPFYRQGKAVFVSRAELAHFIRNKPQPPAPTAKRNRKKVGKSAIKAEVAA